MNQGTLPFADDATLSEKFERWLETPEGAAVFREFIAIARQLREAGHKHYGAKSILEVLRFHRSLRGPANDIYRINNSWGSRLARRAMESDASLDGFFEVRCLKSD